MPAPKIPDTASLQTVRDDLVFSHSRLTAEPAAADLAPLIKGLLDAWGPVHAKQLARWDAQTMADALISAADDRLDALVDRLSLALLALTGGDSKHAHYTLYFSLPPNELKRPVLGDQLETIRKWAGPLANESDPTVKAIGADIAAAVKVAGDAVKARRTADADNEEFRAKGDLAKYLAEVTKIRDTVYAKLDDRQAQDPSLPRGFAAAFFRHRKPAQNGEAKQARADKRAAERAAAEAKKKAVADAKAKVKDAQKALKALSK